MGSNLTLSWFFTITYKACICPHLWSIQFDWLIGIQNVNLNTNQITTHCVGLLVHSSQYIHIYVYELYFQAFVNIRTQSRRTYICTRTIWMCFFVCIYVSVFVVFSLHVHIVVFSEIQSFDSCLRIEGRLFSSGDSYLYLKGYYYNKQWNLLNSDYRKFMNSFQ